MKKKTRIMPGARVEPREIVTLHSGRIRIPDPDRLVRLEFRRFAGCPICKLHLRSIARRHDELVSAGILEVAVFHSPAEALRLHDIALPFPVVADPGKKLYTEFGVDQSVRSILDPRAWWAAIRGLATFGPGPPDPGESALGLPGDFLISASGKVVACKYGAHADDHWSVEEILTLARTNGSGVRPGSPAVCLEKGARP